MKIQEKKTQTFGGRGGRPVEVWVDGHHFSDITTARAEYKALAGRKHKEFTEALYKTGNYRGHTVSLTPPPARDPKAKRSKRPEGILLWGHCTHRLGTY